MSDNSKTYSISETTITAPTLASGLYIVSTPIGNLADITVRALETIAAADIVAAEDTRVSRVLLQHYGIRRKLLSYHEHSAVSVGERLIEEVAAGRSVALISDAGTPLISDPGYRLVEKAVGRDLAVIPIPGASAILAALCVSGLPTDSFFFAGFLPQKAAARKNRLAEVRSIPATLVFYESPGRLVASLAAMADTLGADRKAVVARELTKRFEEVRRDGLLRLAEHYREHGAPKGEVVVLVGPPLDEEPDNIDEMLVALAAEMPASKAAGEAARLTGRRKSELYQRLLALKGERDKHQSETP